jgi:CIC family chloride channel protein
MIAAGAAGGIAATFNTPIGGVLFALEIILHEISVRTLVPVVISTATAAYVGRIFFGDHPSFFIPALETLKFQTTAPSALVSYVGLGIVLGPSRLCSSNRFTFLRIFSNNAYPTTITLIT